MALSQTSVVCKTVTFSIFYFFVANVYMDNRFFFLLVASSDFNGDIFVLIRRILYGRMQLPC